MTMTIIIIIILIKRFVCAALCYFARYVDRWGNRLLILSRESNKFVEKDNKNKSERKKTGPSKKIDKNKGDGKKVAP